MRVISPAHLFVTFCSSVVMPERLLNNHKPKFQQPLLHHGKALRGTTERLVKSRAVVDRPPSLCIDLTITPHSKQLLWDMDRP